MSSLSEVGDDIHVITTENWRLNSGLALAFGALGVLSASLLSAQQMVRAMRPRRR